MYRDHSTKETYDLEKQLVDNVHAILCNQLYGQLHIHCVSLWNTSDMDFVLTEGDKMYKELEATSFLSVDDLPQSIVIENNKIAIEKLRFDQGILSARVNHVTVKTIMVMDFSYLLMDLLFWLSGIKHIFFCLILTVEI